MAARRGSDRAPAYVRRGQRARSRRRRYASVVDSSTYWRRERCPGSAARAAPRPVGRGGIQQDGGGRPGLSGRVGPPRDGRGGLGALGEDGDLDGDRFGGTGIRDEPGQVALEGLLVGP